MFRTSAKSCTFTTCRAASPRPSCVSASKLSVNQRTVGCSLKTSRFRSLHIYNQVSEFVPDGAYLTSVPVVVCFRERCGVITFRQTQNEVNQKHRRDFMGQHGGNGRRYSRKRYIDLGKCRCLVVRCSCLLSYMCTCCSSGTFPVNTFLLFSFKMMHGIILASGHCRTTVADRYLIADAGSGQFVSASVERIKSELDAAVRQKRLIGFISC